MPYTIVAFIWRKEGTSPSEFKSHYETTHIPLLLRLLGSVFPISHTRFYLARQDEDASSFSAEHQQQPPQPIIYVGVPEDFDYDVYAELVFDDQPAFDAFYARMREPDVAAQIAADEEKFIARSRLKVVAVQEPLVTTRPS